MPAQPLPEWKPPTSEKEALERLIPEGTTLSEHAYLTGQTLLWVRYELFKSRTKFRDWVDSKVWFSYRTARRFMAHAKRCKKQLLPYKPSSESKATKKAAPAPILEHRKRVKDAIGEVAAAEHRLNAAVTLRDADTNDLTEQAVTNASKAKEKAEAAVKMERSREPIARLQVTIAGLKDKFPTLDDGIQKAIIGLLTHAINELKSGKVATG